MSASLLELHAPGAGPMALPPSIKRLAQLLDRAIIVLMVMILLTLSWPVSRVFLQQAYSETATSSLASPRLQTRPVSPLSSGQSVYPFHRKEGALIAKHPE